MKVEVLGSGCASCKRLYEQTKTAATEASIAVSVEYVTDIQRIIEMGVMRTPVLAIDGKPIVTGRVPDSEEIQHILREHA